MSEQEKPQSFMQELDRWSDANIIGPLFNTDPNQEDWEDAVASVKKPSAKRYWTATTTARRPDRDGRQEGVMGADLYLLDAQGDEIGYFRDSYGAAMLWEFGLSWWQDVIPMLDANQRLDAKQAGRLLALLKENEPVFAENLARRSCAEQERRRQQYAELKTMLTEATERGIKILCSL